MIQSLSEPLRLGRLGQEEGRGGEGGPGGGEGGGGGQEESQEELHVCVSQRRGSEKLVWWNQTKKTNLVFLTCTAALFVHIVRLITWK